jgi:hypothetical protein
MDICGQWDRWNQAHGDPVFRRRTRIPLSRLEPSRDGTHLLLQAQRGTSSRRVDGLDIQHRTAEIVGPLPAVVGKASKRASLDTQSRQRHGIGNDPSGSGSTCDISLDQAGSGDQAVWRADEGIWLVPSGRANQEDLNM